LVSALALMGALPSSGTYCQHEPRLIYPSLLFMNEVQL